MGNKQSSCFPSQQYKILEEIGAGAFGTVVMAVDKETQHLVAIKNFFRRDAGLAEISNLELVHSFGVPNVVNSLAWWCVEDSVCMVMDLLHGDLYETIKKEGAFSASKIVTIANQVLAALEVLHSNGYAHGDLKPENIVFGDQMKSNVKIIDFGLMRKTPVKKRSYLQSRFYRAPEVVMGLSSGTGIDIWSLGCIVIELITTKPLFPAVDEQSLHAMHTGWQNIPRHMVDDSTRSITFYKKAYPPIAPTPMSLAEPLAGVIRKSLVIDPQKRGSASEVRAALF